VNQLTGILYLACASVGIRLLFAFLGRWLAPLRPKHSVERSVQAAENHPARPPLGDYRAESSR
jgi:hypothetical protein